MQLQTFKAPTMAECLTQVKTSLGTDAIILHTRTYQLRHWMGLRRKEVVEITAGKGMNIGRRPRPGQTEAAKQAVNDSHPGGTYDRRGTVRQPESRPQAAPGPKSLLDTPVATGAAIVGLTNEVTTLKQMLKDFMAVNRQKHAPSIPEELQEHYDLLVRNLVNAETAEQILRTIHRQVRAEVLAQPSVVREKIAEQLEKLLPVAGPIRRSRTDGPHVVALVGPTGVGKTTTLAKLAANLKLRERRKVGLITLDTYRIAAVDQLRRYAEIIGAPLKVVGSADELQTAIASMADLDFILIDTAGRSPKDQLKLSELKRVLEVASPDEVHLVLTATASEACIELAAAHFSEVRVDRVIFTKLDEAANLGVLLNVVQKVNKNVSYVTTGQDVPDDIEVAQSRRLAQLVMGDGIRNV